MVVIHQNSPDDAFQMSLNYWHATATDYLIPMPQKELDSDLEIYVNAAAMIESLILRVDWFIRMGRRKTVNMLLKRIVLGYSSAYICQEKV